MCIRLDILNIKGLEAEAQSRKNRRVSVVVEGNSVLKSQYKSCNNLSLIFVVFFFFLSWDWSSQEASALLEPSGVTANHFTQLLAKLK